ncbi:hypothetical protein [Sinosporangium siamense]|uniref:hypothetical protein n=1 Tax=Sinosporangium siamense TaxID=1367973 RepID=UPI001952987E|nr:hypothetical protein [Sinosporangium siamense]
MRFREGHGILGLLATPDGTRITGTRLRRDTNRLQEALEAALVVDTMGRGSRTSFWLHDLGYQPDQVKVDLAYTTRHFRLNGDPFGRDLAVNSVSTPQHPRGAFFFKLPGDGHDAALTLTWSTRRRHSCDPARCCG